MEGRRVLVLLAIALLGFSAFPTIRVSANVVTYQNRPMSSLEETYTSASSEDLDHPTFKPYKRTTFVYSDPTTYLDEYAFIASIPANVFRDEADNLYAAPIMYGESKAGDYLLEDWKTYCDHWEGDGYLDFIGPYSEDYVSEMKDYLGTENYTSIIADNPYEYAAEIALRDWTNSTSAVITPAKTYFTTPVTTYGEFHGEFFNVTQDYYTSYQFGYVVPTPPPGTHVDLVPPIESPHPYLNNMYAGYYLELSGAAYISIHFPTIDVETGYDYLYIYDRDWNLRATYTGHYEDVWTPPVPGDLVYIILYSDSTVTWWGYIADALVWSATPLPAPAESVIHRGEWLNFTVPAGIPGIMKITVNLLNWTSAIGETRLACFLIDPDGNVVDYDFTPEGGNYTWMIWDINERPRTTTESYTIAIYCMGFDGGADYSLVINGLVQGYSSKPGNLDVYTITVPENARELDAWLSCNSTKKGMSWLRMSLIDPKGHVLFPNYYEYPYTEYPPSPEYLSNIGHLNTPHPTPGNWTLIVQASLLGYYPPEQTVEYTVQYKISLYNGTKLDYVEVAANGAVIASLLNAPLLYTATNALPKETKETLQILGVEEAILVDTAGLISDNVKSQITDTGITIARDLLSLRDIVSYIRSLSGETDLVLTVPTNNFFAPAALAAAFHGAPVLTFKGEAKEIPTLADSTWAAQYYYHEFSGWSYYDWLLKAPPIHWMHELSEMWSEWIGALDADAPGIESVLTVASLVDVKPVFERAIQGIAKAGRTPGENAEEDVAFISRAMLYPAIIYANPGYNVTMPTCVAYDYGIPDVASDIPPELVQPPDYKPPEEYIYPVNGWENTTEAMEDRNFTVEAHVGKYEVFEKLNSGVAFWYHSNHGGLGFVWDYLPFGQGVIGLWYEDPPDPQPKRGYEYNMTTYAENASVPDQYSLPFPEIIPYPPYVSPYPDGAVYQVLGEAFSYAFGGEIDRWLGNIHSAHTVFMDCYIGGSMLPVTMMRHGAASAIGDMRTGLLIDADWFCVKYTQEVMASKTLGEAFVTAVTKTGYAYPKNYFNMTLFKPAWVYNYTIMPSWEEPWYALPYVDDGSNAFVLYGDPDSVIVDPTSPEPEAFDPTEISVLGHNPDHVTRGISVTITAPSTGAHVGGVTGINWIINLQNTVLRSCLLYIDGSVSDVTHLASYSWDTTEVSDGNHTVKLVASDLIGSVSSTTIWVTVDNTLTRASIKSPGEGAKVKGEAVVCVEASDPSGIQRVEFYIDDELKNTDYDPPYEWVWDTTQHDDGLHAMKAVAYDVLENSEADQVTVTVDNTSPVISIRSPNSGATVGGETVEITVQATDSSGIAWIEFYLNGEMVYNDTEGLRCWTWNTTRHDDGTYALKAVAYDTVLNTNEDQIAVTVDNTEPSVSITSPEDGAELSGTTDINFTATDDNLDKVFLCINDATFDVTGETLYEWDTTEVGDGTHTIKLVAYDKAGNTNGTAIAVTTVNVKREVEATRNLYLGIGTPIGLIIGVIIAYVITKRWP